MNFHFPDLRALCADGPERLQADDGPDNCANASASPDDANLVLCGVPVGNELYVLGRRGGPEFLDSELPEADHNEICAWKRGRDAAPLVGVFLVDPDQHPRVHSRIELTAAEVERAGAPVMRVEARGDSRLERVLSLVLLGDLVSVYLAVLEGVDPTPVEAIERFKAALG